MRRLTDKIKRFFIIIFTFSILAGNITLTAFASGTDDAAARGSYYIEDELGLFYGEDMDSLYSVMDKLTEYGNVLLLTAELKAGEADSYCDRRYVEIFGYTEGVVFLIDMGDRILWFKGMEDTDRIITDSICNTITDNVYTYASDGDYVKVSEKAFEQALTVLSGNKIGQPLKYISNIFFAFGVSFLICFMMLKKSSDKAAPESIDTKDVLGGIVIAGTGAAVAKKLLDTKKVYIPPSSSSSGAGSYHSSSGSHHSSGGSHHSSGGSHHSSGGGHHF